MKSLGQEVICLLYKKFLKNICLLKCLSIFLITFFIINNAVFKNECSTLPLVMLQTWKKSVGKGKVFGALLANLPKAFDCLDHKLLTAKLNAYDFNY